jgi:hypothetical protein
MWIYKSGALPEAFPHIDAFQTIKHLPLLIIDSERLEHLTVPSDMEQPLTDHVERNAGVSTRQV